MHAHKHTLIRIHSESECGMCAYTEFVCPCMCLNGTCCGCFFPLIESHKHKNKRHIVVRCYAYTATEKKPKQTHLNRTRKGRRKKAALSSLRFGFPSVLVFSPIYSFYYSLALSLFYFLAGFQRFSFFLQYCNQTNFKIRK